MPTPLAVAAFDPPTYLVLLRQAGMEMGWSDTYHAPHQGWYSYHCETEGRIRALIEVNRQNMQIRVDHANTKFKGLTCECGEPSWIEYDAESPNPLRLMVCCDLGEAAAVALAEDCFPEGKIR